MDQADPALLSHQLDPKKHWNHDLVFKEVFQTMVIYWLTERIEVIRHRE